MRESKITFAEFEKRKAEQLRKKQEAEQKKEQDDEIEDGLSYPEIFAEEQPLWIAKRQDIKNQSFYLAGQRT